MIGDALGWLLDQAAKLTFTEAFFGSISFGILLHLWQKFKARPPKRKPLPPGFKPKTKI